jgi:carbamoyltransferase
MTLILGLNAYHGDASACLVRDGVLITAVEEERFRRWAGFPAEAIRHCMRQAGIGLANVDYMAVNSDPKAQLSKRFFFAPQSAGCVACPRSAAQPEEALICCGRARRRLPRR